VTRKILYTSGGIDIVGKGQRHGPQGITKLHLRHLRTSSHSIHTWTTPM